MTQNPDIEEYVINACEEIFGVGVRAKPTTPNTTKIVARLTRWRAIDIVNEGGGLNRTAFMLGVMAAIPNDSLLLIEEPEANLHPSANTSYPRFLLK